MILKVRLSTDATMLTIHVKEMQTLLSIRQEIAKNLGFSLDKIYLCYDQEILDDDNKFEDYGLQGEAILHCVVKPSSGQNVSIKLDSGEIIDLGFQQSDTVNKLKRIIGEKAFGRRCPMILFYKGTRMEEGMMLKDYGLKDKEEIMAFRTIS